jgi:hypothetical protein
MTPEMSEEEIEFVKVDALKPSLRNVNVTRARRISYCAMSTISAFGAFVLTEFIPFLQLSFDS